MLHFQCYFQFLHQSMQLHSYFLGFCCTIYSVFYFCVCVSLGFDLISYLLLWLLVWTSQIIFQSKLSSRLSHGNSIFLCKVPIFPLKSFYGCTLYVIFSQLRFSITICTLSSQKGLIFPVPPPSDRFLINILYHLFPILLLMRLYCHVSLCLYGSWKMNLLILSCMLGSSDFSNHLQT